MRMGSTMRPNWTDNSAYIIPSRNLLQVNLNPNTQNLDEPITPRSVSARSSSVPSLLISTRITFKECVNLLHYCRLVYKLLVSMRSCNLQEDIHFSQMNIFLMNSLSEISEKIECKGILYDAENVWLREKKLR